MFIVEFSSSVEKDIKKLEDHISKNIVNTLKSESRKNSYQVRSTFIQKIRGFAHKLKNLYKNNNIYIYVNNNICN